MFLKGSDDLSIGARFWELTHPYEYARDLTITGNRVYSPLDAAQIAASDFGDTVAKSVAQGLSDTQSTLKWALIGIGVLAVAVIVIRARK